MSMPVIKVEAQACETAIIITYENGSLECLELYFDDNDGFSVEGGFLFSGFDLKTQGLIQRELDQLNESANITVGKHDRVNDVASRLPTELLPDELSWDSVLSAITQLKEDRDSALADKVKFEQALRDIKRHQEMCVKGMPQMSVTWRIAENTLKSLN